MIRAAASAGAAAPPACTAPSMGMTLLAAALPIRARDVVILLAARSLGFALLPRCGCWITITLTTAPGWPPYGVVHFLVACLLAACVVRAEARAFRAWAAEEAAAAAA